MLNTVTYKLLISIVTGLVLEVVKFCVLESEIWNSLRGENHRCLMQASTDPGRHVVMATEVFAVAPNICGPAVWNLIHIAFLAPRIFERLLDFWKICGPSVFMYL